MLFFIISLSSVDNIAPLHYKLFCRLNVWTFSVGLNVTMTTKKEVVNFWGKEKCTPEKIMAMCIKKWTLALRWYGAPNG